MFKGLQFVFRELKIQFIVQVPTSRLEFDSIIFPSVLSHFVVYDPQIADVLLALIFYEYEKILNKITINSLSKKLSWYKEKH